MKTTRFWLTMMLPVVLLSCAGTKNTPARPPQPAAPAPAAMTSREAGVEPAVAADPSFIEARGALLPGVPPFPAYPGATLVGSAERNLPNAPKQGYTIKWTTTDSPAKVMAWYQTELRRQGWIYTPPTDGATTEQTARIRRGGTRGTVNVEAEAEVTEIEVVLGRK